MTLKVCVPVKIYCRHGLQLFSERARNKDPFATKNEYMRGQEETGGGRRGGEEEESMAKGVRWFRPPNTGKVQREATALPVRLIKRIFRLLRFGHVSLWVWGSLLSIYHLP